MQPVRPGGAAPRSLAVLAFGGLICASQVAHADDLQQLELGKTRFDNGQYEEAAQRFAAMLDPDGKPCPPVASSDGEPCRLTDPDLIERARTLHAAALVALKRDTEAEAEIATILRANPTYLPDAAVLPQEVIDKFTLVRARLREELEAEAKRRSDEAKSKRAASERADEDEKRWLEGLMKAASEQRVVVKNSRIVAAVPFGLGQFQNGSKNLGYFFAISEGVTASVAIVASQFFTYYASFDPTLATAVEREDLLQRQKVALAVNQIAFGLWASLSVAGIVQAQAAFVPEKVTVQRRVLPPRPQRAQLQMLPTVTASPGGGFSVGLVGVF